MSPSVSIPKRKLGKTGLEVTVLGCGGAPLGGLFQVCRLNESSVQQYANAYAARRQFRTASIGREPN